MSSILEYKVGDQIPSRKWIPTELQLRQYAEASGDYNPIHLDEKYAVEAGLIGIIAHGMLTMAQMGVMLTDWLQRNGTISQFKVNFKGMVRPGDTVIFEGQIKERLGNIVRCELEAQNQEEILVISGTAVLILND